MKKIFLALLLTMICAAHAMATPMNVKLTIVRQANDPLLPGPKYFFTGSPADSTLQNPGEFFSAFFVIATPADPANNVYLNLADAQANFMANDMVNLVAQVNNDFGTTFSGVGTASPFDQNLQDSLAALIITHTPATVSRTINGSATQCSDSTKDNLVLITLTQAQTISLTSGQSGTLSLQTSSTSGGTYTEFSRIGNGNSGTLTLGLNLTNTGTGVLMGWVPKGYYYKIISGGTGTNTVVTGKEVTM